MFESLIKEDLATALLSQKINAPTLVQQKSIPLIKEGIDLIVMSNTGTGKTLAYLLPMFEKIDMTIKQPQVLIITPTHELASQVQREAEKISTSLNNGIESALIIGGANLKRQIERLKEKPRIIIGSAGRILELIKLKKLTTHYVKTIVLDEADRMIDDLNITDVKAVIKTTLKDRQILMFSATIDDKTLNPAKEICKDNVQVIKIEPESNLPSNIEHIYFECERREKIKIIKKVVAAEKITKALIFINKQDDLEDLVKKLQYDGIKACGLYGGALKRERKQALIDLREGRKNVLVATDIASRGLDIKDVDYIFNVDVPENPTFYVHRAGRTGRMGAKGVSIIIATKGEVTHIKKLEKTLKIQITKKDIANGKIFDIKKQ
jgi:ATP-dependent RNA helicase DeaD